MKMGLQIKNRFVVISGCSGGGKSTLLSELKKQGYHVVPEVGRRIVQEQLSLNGHSTPWENPLDFCELLVSNSIQEYKTASVMPIQKNNLIFFDRSVLEGICYLNSLKINKYDYLLNEINYFHKVFIVEPWKEIFCNDNERKHSFHDAVVEYERLMKFYAKIGYSVIKIPKNSVFARAKFLINYFKEDLND